MINYTYHCKFNSQEDKYIAENCLPIGKVELYSNPKNKNKKKGEQDNVDYKILKNKNLMLDYSYLMPNKYESGLTKKINKY